jgi:hypothetical protein
MTLVVPIVSLNVQLETVVLIVSLNDGRHWPCYPGSAQIHF